MITDPMYVQIEKISADRNEANFHTGFKWDQAADTRKAYLEAKSSYAVPFDQAAYLIDL